jgi:hypothetical protein
LKLPSKAIPIDSLAREDNNPTLIARADDKSALSDKMMKE